MPSAIFRIRDTRSLPPRCLEDVRQSDRYQLIGFSFTPVRTFQTFLSVARSLALTLSLSRSPSPPDSHQLPLYLLVDATLTMTESKGLWQARAAAADERTLLGTCQAFSLGYHPVQPPRSARPWKAGRAAGVGGRG